MNEQAYSLVLETLHQAASQNPEILKPAEEKLKSWNTEPGFHSYLVVSSLLGNPSYIPRY